MTKKSFFREVIENNIYFNICNYLIHINLQTVSVSASHYLAFLYTQPASKCEM